MKRPVDTSQLIDALTLSARLPKTFSSAASIENLKKLAGDASSRSYYRVVTPAKTYVLQCAEPFVETQVASHPFLSAQQLFLKAGLAVPQVIELCAEHGWILLEDLGDKTLQDSPSLELYKRAIDMLVRWTVKIQRQNFDQGAPHFDWAFDFEKLNAEMSFTAEHLINQKFKLSASDFLSATKANSKFLAECPRVLCHRDYHSRNLMIRNDELFVIDFQDARMGPVSYDLVSLVWDPYVRMSDMWRDELLKYWKDSLLGAAKAAGFMEMADYIQKSSGSSSGPSSGLEEELSRMKIQRLLKAAGSYASFYNLKGRSDYLPSINPALKDALLACQNLAKLGKAEVQLSSLLESYQKILAGLLTP